MPLDDMESTLAVEQYIQQLVRKDKNDYEAIVALPAGQDDMQWVYEHLRRFCLELNGLVLALEGHCTAERCGQMKATDEWLYFCAAHNPPQECSAIDYSVHTLDGAGALLNSKKWFPARSNFSKKARQHFESIARRLYRIFAHAYFHHRSVYDEFETETSLCHRFSRLSELHQLLPASQMLIPISHADDSASDISDISSSRTSLKSSDGESDA